MGKVVFAIVLSFGPFFVGTLFKSSSGLIVDIALSNVTKSVATLKDGMLFLGDKVKTLVDSNF